MGEVVRHFKGSARDPMNRFLATLDLKHLIAFVKEFRCCGPDACINCSACSANTYSAHLPQPKKTMTISAWDTEPSPRHFCLIMYILNQSLGLGDGGRAEDMVRFAFGPVSLARWTYKITLSYPYHKPADIRGSIKLSLRKQFNLGKFLYLMLPIWDDIKMSRHIGERLDDKERTISD